MTTETTMTTDEYQGWTNRETWAAALWINNDQGLQEMAMEQARLDEWGDGLKEWVAELAEEVQERPAETTHELRMMIHDIGSLWRVDWKEIRDALLEP